MGVVDGAIRQSTADELLGRSGGRWGSGVVCVGAGEKERDGACGCQAGQLGLGQEERKRRRSQLTALVSSV
jgi:hypothetical protein